MADKNVIPLQQVRKTVPSLSLESGEHHITDQEQIIEALRKRMQNTRQLDKTVARETGLCTSTVSRIKYGETKKPRLDTIIKLLVHFDFVVTVRSRRNVY